jgi:catechol 2,3-dioxygenase-like lactoylglutathione lyase family enzyme
MLDHLTVKVRDAARSKAFYAAALEPVGYAVRMEYEGGAGLGAEHPDLWLAADPGEVRPMHFAFTAKARRAVDAFHAAALAAGGRDNGAPGLRPDYGPTYYAAFVLDPDGHNVEVVCHAREGGARRTAKKAAPRRTARRTGSPKRTSKRRARR